MKKGLHNVGRVLALCVLSYCVCVFRVELFDSTDLTSRDKCGTFSTVQILNCLRCDFSADTVIHGVQFSNFFFLINQ